jgi:hypothetical protein
VPTIRALDRLSGRHMEPSGAAIRGARRAGASLSAVIMERVLRIRGARAQVDERAV